MRSPHTGRPMRLVEGEPATYTLRGEQFGLGGPCYECDSTGERFVTDEQEFAMQEQLHRAWRTHHGIGPDALHQRREALGLSAAETAALLGLSARRYRALEETGLLPSKASAVLLKLLVTQDGLAALARVAGETLGAAGRAKLARFLE